MPGRPERLSGRRIHERAKKLAARKRAIRSFVDPATWDARAKRQLETARECSPKSRPRGRHKVARGRV